MTPAAPGEMTKNYVICLFLHSLDVICPQALIVILEKAFCLFQAYLHYMHPGYQKDRSLITLERLRVLT